MHSRRTRHAEEDEEGTELHNNNNTNTTRLSGYRIRAHFVHVSTCSARGRVDVGWASGWVRVEVRIVRAPATNRGESRVRR